MGTAYKHLILAVIPALLGVPGHALSAQEAASADTTPFKRGQWALQFGGGANFGSLGALKFTSSRSAWLIDFQVNGSHSVQRVRIAPDTVLESHTSFATATSRFGRRAYQPHHAVASYETVGLLGGFAHSCYGSFFAGTNCSNGWTAGAFGEVGAIYLITPHLSLGGAVGLSLAYTRTRNSSPGQPSVSSWSYSGSLGTLSLNTALYF
jgi:hypothetical protein